LTSAAVILGTVIGACWLDYWYNFDRPGIWLAPLCLLLAVLAAGEVLDLLKTKDLRPAPWVVYAGTLLVVSAACAPLLFTEYPRDFPIGKAGWPLAAMALAVAMAFLGEMLRYKTPGNVMVHTALAVFTVAYVGLPLAFLAQLRFFGDERRNAVGMAALLSMVAVAKCSDAGAYAFGRMFGRHKLVPRLSPAKTIEGAVGGFLAACAASFVMFWLITPLIVGPDAAVTPWWGCLFYGILVCIAAMVGDLAESLLKRDMERKDSSNWLPGLGGVLDFMDSLLLAAPVAYLCWVFGLVRA